jgi:hypothetical protein
MRRTRPPSSSGTSSAGWNCCSPVGQAIVVIGLVIVAIGALIWAGVPLGRLPGDFVYRRDGFTFYFPMTTAILVSVVLTLLGWLFRR